MSLPSPIPASECENPSGCSSERRRVLLLMLAVLPAYVWFYQGAGDGQKAHFNTVRAIVEHRTFRIDVFERDTGDVSFYEDRIYSNKPPGLPVLGAIVYAPVYAIEQRAGMAPDDPNVKRWNEYLIGIWCCALPGAAVAGLLYCMFRRQDVPWQRAMALAGAFAYGSLLWPYAGALSVHDLNALCVIGAWALLTCDDISFWRIATAGLVMGLGITSNYLLAPVAALYGAWIVWEQRRLRPAVAFGIGPVVAVLLLMWYGAANFGSPLANSNTYQAQAMSEEGKLFGMFGLPDPRMLYWLTFHPFRGVFYYCPVLLIGLVGLIMRWRDLRNVRRCIPILVVLYFFIANASFNGWTGGWFAGPRYLIPAMPMLYLYAAPALRKFPRIAGVLIAISILNMLAIASVRLVFPAPSFGPPPPLSDSFSNPIAECIRRWTFNQVARQVGSFNLGMKLGLTNVASIFPVVMWCALFWTVLWLRSERKRPGGIGNRTDEYGNQPD